MVKMWNLFEEESITFEGEAKKYLPCPVWKKEKPWKIDSTLALTCIKNAEEYLQWQPKVITASEFMLYFETGDRVLFGNEFFKRRSALGSMLIAECIEAKGRFVKKIADMAWMICEESYWGLPATKPIENEYDDILPNDEYPALELFTCETGNLLSYVLYIMKDAFEEISPMLVSRIKREIEKRIIIPFLEREDFWWMCLRGKSGMWKISNWTPWCYSNCLSVLLMMEDSETKRTAGLKKVMRGLGNFLADYRSDGGCDEGCGYWSRAAGSVFDCLELMHAATDGQLDVYSWQLIKDMGEYIVSCYVGNGYFVNFADASATIIPEAELVHRYGERINSNEMRVLGRNFIDTYLKERYFVISQSPMRLIPAIFNYDKVKNDTAKVRDSREKFYKVTQVCMVHPSAEWFFAAKGGHNNEAHNHNDIGSFVLYYKENPIFIDVGVEEYSGKTFGANRYELWTMQSDYHNLPKINGVSQSPGKDFHADCCKCEDMQFECEIQNAYPPEAGVEKWQRKIYYENGSIFIAEDFELKKEASYEMMFMTPIKPQINDSEVVLNEVSMLYDKEVFNVEFDTIELEDEKLKKTWGILYRLRFSNVQKTTGSNVVFEIKNK